MNVKTHKKTLRRKLKAKTRSQVRTAYTAKGARVVSATEAARSFSELLDRVCYRGESFVIERGGEPVCEISHVKSARFNGADFVALLDSLPKPDPTYWDAVEVTTRQKPMVPESRWER